MSQDKNRSVASKLNDSTFAAGEVNGHFEAMKEIQDQLPRFVQAVKAWVSSNPMWFPDASLQAWARLEAEGEDLRTDDLEMRLKQVLGVAAAEPSAGPSAVSPSQTPEDAAAVPNAFYQVGESIRTQDNLATAEPLFCVFQKERVYGLDPAYTEDIVWYDEESEADAATSKKLENQWQLDRREPGTWHRTGYKDVDRFVTACFTQDSAKAYILANQHNLKKPFIYVETLYRNPEMITLRQWLKSLRQPIFSGAVLSDSGELTTRDGVKYVRASDTPQMTCKSCGNPIEHNGKHWMHVGISPRHPAVPSMPVPEARRTPSWEKPVLGYFRKGGTKWMLVQVDGNSLTGYDIAPGGGVHTLHIAREEVDAFVLINKD